MTRRDYVLIADAMARTNPNFDRDRFVAACGVRK